MPVTLTMKINVAVAAVALGAIFTSLHAAAPGTQPAAAPLRLEPFQDLPEFKPPATTGPAKISAGTEGVAPPADVLLRPGMGGTVAILGDLAPADGNSEKYL